MPTSKAVQSTEATAARTHIRRRISAVVISANMQKTIVVQTSALTKHPKYGKYFKVYKKLKVHDEKNECKPGDKIEIVESKPISREKRFRLVKVVEKSRTGGLTDESENKLIEQ